MPGTAPEITLRFLAAPMDVGHEGAVHGGRVLEWIDKAGYACAVGWSGRYCVTAYVGNIRFARPIQVGDLLEIRARIVHTGRTSMHIAVSVSSADPREGTFTVATDCLLIFVAVDGDGRPTAVPPWGPRTDAEARDEEMAVHRISLRADIEQAMSRQSYTDAGRAPRTTLRFLAAPGDVNWGGKVHGGTVMRWIDEAAYVVALGWHAGPSIAAYAGGVRFYRPLLIGHLVEVEARLLYTSGTGMHIAVHVRSGDPRTGTLELTTHCLIVFVALDEERRAAPVRQWIPVGDEDRALAAHAAELVELRRRVPST
jgi:4-hydroxybenzoyl-CoA thioesterase